MRSALFIASRSILLLCCMQGMRALQQAFRVQPDNVTVVDGGEAILQCEVESLSGAVQWVKDGLLLGPDRSMPGFPRYSMTGESNKGEFHLKIEHSKLEDDAPYECQVGQSESSAGIISHTVWITVLIPPRKPTIVEHPENVEVVWVAGIEYTLTCQVTDTKPAAELKFWKSGVELTGEDSSSVGGSKDKLSSMEAVIRVTPQSSDNGRRMECLAFHPAVSQPLRTGFTMKVLFPPQPPRIEGYDKPEVKAKDTLKLECKSTGGNPLATLQWSKNDEVLSTSWEIDAATNTARSLLTMEVKPEDNMAKLTCEAVNEVTPIPLQHTIQLRVVFLPSEVTILGSPRGAENKQITLSCFTTASNPPVQIRWWLGFRELNTTEVTITEASNGGMVTMSNVTHTLSRDESQQQLTCEAFNEAIRYTKSHSVEVSVYYPPQKVWVEGHPENMQLRAGNQLKMTCFASGGNPVATLTWYKDNKSVRDAQSPVQSGKIVSRDLIIKLQPNDNLATYMCNASNQAKAPPLSVSTKLHVQFPPISMEITAASKQVKRGHSLTLTCTAGSSNPIANVSWTKNGEKLKQFDLGKKRAEYGGESQMSRVYIKAASSDNGKRVSCLAYSYVLAEGVNTFYRLNVLYPPEFAVDQPKLVQAAEHSAALLPLKVSANPVEMSCNWTFRGEDLVREKTYRHHVKDGGMLEIWNLTRADAGEYGIRCANAEGENSTVVQLDVQYSPSIKSLADPTEVDLGGSVEILCTADANPVIENMFSWRWLGDEEREIDASRQLQEGPTGKLAFTDAQRTDAGRYECLVNNGLPPPAKGEVRLIVRFKPELQKGVHLSKVAAFGDGTGFAQLTCKAEGIPNVAFSWAKNGVGLDLNHPRYSEKTVNEGIFHTSTLTIVNVSAVNDYAIFTCTARNPLGLDVFDIQLVSTSRPDPPTNLKVVSITHNSVTLQWSEGFNGGLEQKFRVRYHWEEAQSFMYVDVFPPQATIFTITGLMAATPYNFSVNSLNAMGESEYADGNAILTVTTKGSPPIIIQFPEGPPFPEPTPAETSGLPLYLIVVLAVVGGTLLILNSVFAGCLAKRWKGKNKEKDGVEGKSKEKEGKYNYIPNCRNYEAALVEKKKSLTFFKLMNYQLLFWCCRLSLTELNQYEDGELINKAAKQTLLIDSGSDLSSSVYESVGEDSASDFGQYYYHSVKDYRPSLYTLPEDSEGLSDGRSSYVGGRFTQRWNSYANSHDYEEVKDFSLYEDAGRIYSLPASSDYYQSMVKQNGQVSLMPKDDYKAAYPRRGKGPTGWEESVRTYESTAFHLPSTRTYDVPFEMMGELV
ncbi:nephrin [Erpetoichthys calabaricus]|uniref:nephrin n=1 Tax=Erpetoichthys calabaricus TaxID=27687 RepID=UPI0022345BD2|nr:nephrin [Erpetoichthys calabaricus]